MLVVTATIGAGIAMLLTWASEEIYDSIKAANGLSSLDEPVLSRVVSLRNRRTSRLPTSRHPRGVVTEDHAERVSATVPLGDAELVEGIRGHLNHVVLRAAGATSIIEGDVDAT